MYKHIWWSIAYVTQIVGKGREHSTDLSPTYRPVYYLSSKRTSSLAAIEAHRFNEVAKSTFRDCIAATCPTDRNSSPAGRDWLWL